MKIKSLSQECYSISNEWMDGEVIRKSHSRLLTSRMQGMGGGGGGGGGAGSPPLLRRVIGGTSSSVSSLPMIVPLPETTHHFTSKLKLVSHISCA